MSMLVALCQPKVFGILPVGEELAEDRIAGIDLPVAVTIPGCQAGNAPALDVDLAVAEEFFGVVDAGLVDVAIKVRVRRKKTVLAVEPGGLLEVLQRGATCHAGLQVGGTVHIELHAAVTQAAAGQSAS